jgi:hypothetical protein
MTHEPRSDQQANPLTLRHPQQKAQYQQKKGGKNRAHSTTAAALQ